MSDLSICIVSRAFVVVFAVCEFSVKSESDYFGVNLIGKSGVYC